MAALDGIRVLDLTVWFQGPVAAQHLADFGAEVIHVENPKGGDQGRGVRSIKALPVGDWNQYFLVINRNKKSLAVDLKKPAGRKLLVDLVEKSDVFLSNVGNDNLERYGLGYQALSAVNPALVYATTTGYGPFGTNTKPSFDMTVQALTGLMTRLGEPGEPPIYLGMGSGDAHGGLMAAFAIAMALYQRKRTGKGQVLDASLYGSQLFLAAPTLQRYLASRSQRESRQVSRRDLWNPTWNLFPARDRWLFLCVKNHDAAFAELAETIGHEVLASDPRFATAEARRANRAALVDALDAIFREHTAGQWMDRFGAAGIVASPVQTLADLADDPQAWANDYFVTAFCEEVKREVKGRGLPVTLGKTPGVVQTLGPELGQDTEMILFETLGYDWDTIGNLKADGVIP
jgi:crotonobetainyl-CoA:carnitine CoA-transferase CaiB-like acyl-CoA transferase